MKFVFVLALVALKRVSATIKMCGQFETYSRGDFIVNNNAWNQDDFGTICTLTDEVGSPTITNVFSAIWLWYSTPMTVRAYPNIQYTARDLPLRLNELMFAQVNASWSLGLAGLPAFVTPDPNTPSNSRRLSASNVQTDVAFDIFLDEDKNTTMNFPNDCKYEVMIWLGRFGHNARPIGHEIEREPPLTQTVSGIEFTLVNGTNANGQTVFTWVASGNITTPQIDIAPLLQYLPRHGLMPFDVYLGPIHFGSETFYSENHVNFTLHDFSMEVRAGSTDQNLYDLPEGAWKDKSRDPDNLQTGGGSGGSLKITQISALWLISILILVLTLLV